METEKELVENVENTSKVEKKTRDYIYWRILWNKYQFISRSNLWK